MNRFNLLYAQLLCAIVFLTSSNTFAGSTTTFVPISNGVFDDPTLSGFTTYAYRVTTDVDWTNSDFGIYLTSGTLNHIQPTGPFGGSHNQLNGLGDTAVFAPLNNLGDLSGGLSGPAGYIAADNFESSNEFYGYWFNTSNNNIGTFDIGMITISNDANGSLSYRTITGSTHEDGPGGFGRFTPDYSIVNGQIVELTQSPTPIPGPQANNPTDPPVSDPQISTEFVQISNGLFDDSTLDNFNTFAMRVSTNEDWTSSALDIQLSQGTFNHVSPGEFQNEESVNGLGDTAGMAPLNQLGDLSSGLSNAITYFNHTESPNHFRSDWATYATNEVGTFDVAMITFSKDAKGILNYRSISAGTNIEHGGYLGLGKPLYIRNGQIYTTVPEPSGILFSLFATACLISKRYKN